MSPQSQGGNGGHSFGQKVSSSKYYGNAGNGGQGGNGGQSISMVYCDSLRCDEDPCPSVSAGGKGGAAGSLDREGGVIGNEGSAGVNGTNGTRSSDLFYDIYKLLYD